MIYHLHQKNPARASEFALTEDYIVVYLNKDKEIKGDYFSLLDYLKKIKEVKEKLFLKSVNYRVEKYPLGKLTLTISTMSSDDEFIEL